MTKSQRRTVTEVLTEISPYTLDGDLDETIQRLIEERAAYSQRLTGNARLRLDWDPNFYYDYDQNPSPRFLLKLDREENDDEFNARILKEAQYRQEQERREREEYLRLQEKFGNKS